MYDSIYCIVTMKTKVLGVKHLQANISTSFPQVGEETIVTKRNVPTYRISTYDPGVFSVSTGGGFVTDKVNRVEVIDHTKEIDDGGGRAFVKWAEEGAVEVKLHLQDEDRTLKIIISQKGGE